jgi:hypothetical protein
MEDASIEKSNRISGAGSIWSSQIGKVSLDWYNLVKRLFGLSKIW